ncbi:formin-2 [Punica granatum]|uniref:Uncharacterized protein n=2 Tax=Punica granatum TaxID=22663 RepID=A0A218XHK7_PUNGR|nr:formin-2 [Punica granatum]OWM83941.1 hypothetical protein CDL15_Pgr004372 [Punica granatum]PKI78715.1 hypothetical protein CRG98_000940 [Punica granatum]
MDCMQRYIFGIFFILAAVIGGTRGKVLVSGLVYCDQCKDGKYSHMDYPLKGVTVIVSCTDRYGRLTVSKQLKSNLYGNYSIVFDGNPDLSSCMVGVSASGQDGADVRCMATVGPPRSLKLIWQMSDISGYEVDPLYTHPAELPSFCPKASPKPAPPPKQQPTLPPPSHASPPPVKLPPAPPVKLPPTPPVKLPPRAPPVKLLPPAPPAKRPPPAPPIKRPPAPPSWNYPPITYVPYPGYIPMPKFDLPMPELPFLGPPFQGASACPHKMWLKPEYKCFWMVDPNTKAVALFDSPFMPQVYGTDVTLLQALQGGGDPYRDLLREATTALLNTYHSISFPYVDMNMESISTEMDMVLSMSSEGDVISAAQNFMRLNSGYGRVPCNFTPCK